MFQHFDHDGGLTQEQLRQAVRKIFTRAPEHEWLKFAYPPDAPP